jgi:hypothetical protein
MKMARPMPAAPPNAHEVTGRMSSFPICAALEILFAVTHRRIYSVGNDPFI